MILRPVSGRIARLRSRGQEGLKDLLAIEAIYQSIEKRTSVDVQRPSLNTIDSPRIFSASRHSKNRGAIPFLSQSMWHNEQVSGVVDVSGLPTMTPEFTNRQEPDERVTLYQTFGYPIAGGSVWRILVQGQIGEVPPKLRSTIIAKRLIRALELTPDIVSGDLFGKRISGFLLNPISGERIQIELAGQRYVLRRNRNAAVCLVAK